MKTVDKLVSEWTEEERKKFKDLIKECQERERRLIENSRVCKDNLSKLTESLISLLSNSQNMNRSTVKFADDLSGIYLQLCNKKTPSA
jgi:Mg2+ and Co2+ transporter CorA